MPTPPNPNYSDLDQHQIFQRAFDESIDRLRVDAVASIDPGSMEVVITHVDDSIRIGDGTDIMAVNADGSINVSAVISSGSKVIITDGTDDLSINADGSINVTNISGTVSLPTGASTSALQVIGNTSLSSIDIKLTDKSQFTKLTDGTDDVLVTTAGELNVLSTAQPGVDIGDVTVNNTGGVSAVNIQDGGNSITVDGTVSAVQSGTWNINDITGAVSLPTGAATSALQTTGNSSLSSIDSKLNTLGQKTSSGSVPVVLSSEQGTIDNPIVSGNQLFSSFSPDPSSYGVGVATPALDGRERLESHSTVLTDEGSFRDDFIGSSLNTTLTGTITFTNNDSTITGSGTLFTTEIKNGQYLKKTTDSETLWVSVSSVISDTELELSDVYTGTTASTSGHISNWKTVTGSGSFGVASSNVTIGSGTAVGTTYLIKDADYGPFTVSYKISISQRIANQTIRFGVVDNPLSPSKQAIFEFTGTTNTLVTCTSSSSSSASDTQTTSITLPNNLTSASSIEYSINVSNDQITFIIAGVVVAQYRDHIFGAYDNLDTFVYINNAAIVTNTNITFDWHNFYNINQVEIANSFTGEPLVLAPVQIKETVVPTYSSAGGVTTAANPTDIFTLTGSSTKVIRVKRIGVSGSATNPATRDLLVIKRSTANTGGTSTTPSVVPLDSDDVAGTAVFRAYTANPTVGTSIGEIRRFKLVIPQAVPLGGVGASRVEDFTFADLGQKSVVLRGTSEVLSINMNGVTLTGGSMDCFIEWTEENS